MLNGRSPEMGHGPIALFGLREARAKAEDARKLRHEGIDPIEARRETRLGAQLDAAKSMIFKECATAYIASCKPSWRNEKYRAQWRPILATYVYPIMGALPVQAIDTATVMKVLAPIWSTKPETVSRVRIEAVLG